MSQFLVFKSNFKTNYPANSDPATSGIYLKFNLKLNFHKLRYLS